MNLKFSTQKYLFLFFGMLFLSLLIGCTRDKVEVVESQCQNEINYDQHIQLVLDNNCNATGCHNSNSSNGDFTSYSNISLFFEGGALHNRTINQKNMPPNATLSDSDIEMFKCWIEGGYLEN